MKSIADRVDDLVASLDTDEDIGEAVGAFVLAIHARMHEISDVEIEEGDED